jgi:hypothetical protein
VRGLHPINGLVAGKNIAFSAASLAPIAANEFFIAFCKVFACISQSHYLAHLPIHQ